MRILLGIALALVGAADDTPVDVAVTLDPPEIPFHRQARFSIVVEAPDDLDVQLPEMVDKFGGLEASDIQRTTESLRHNRRRITESYTLDPILRGNYGIEPVEVTWGDGQRIVTPSPGMRVRDLTDEEREAALRFEPNDAGLIGMPHPLVQHWPKWAGAALVILLALGALAYPLWRRKREVKQAPPPVPWEVAYRRLRELDQRHLPEAEKYEPYYVDLSAILRYYIEDRFHLHAPEQTTPEFLASSAQSGALSDAHQDLLDQFLRHCDLVKFARYVPTVEEMEKSFEIVLQFVDETVPQPETDEQEKAA